MAGSRTTQSHTQRDNKIKQTKKALIKALESSLGVVTTACNAVGVNRGTFYGYYNNDPEFREAVDEIENVALDFAESSLHQQIADKIPASTIFYLKTKGRKRGYIERNELDVSGTFAPIAGTDAAIMFLSEAVKQAGPEQAVRLLGEWKPDGVTDAAKEKAIELVLQGGVYGVKE